MSRSMSRRAWFGVSAYEAWVVALAVWYLWSGSRWPALLSLIVGWLGCALFRRSAGVLFWVLFAAASVLVVLWLLGYLGLGIGAIVGILTCAAIAFAKPSTSTDEPA